MNAAVKKAIMDYQKPYWVKEDGDEIFLLNGRSSGEKEYKIDSKDLSQRVWPAVALNRDDNIKIPNNRINSESMEILKQAHPEFFL
jgi:hypothetical protein